MTPGQSRAGRWAEGDQTRARLLDAAEQLLAERGEQATSLRDITARADANVAAVKYHFGSKDRLVEAVLRRALEQVADAQLARLDELSAQAGPDEVLAAWVGPIAAALTAPPGPSRLAAQVVGRVVGESAPQLRAMVAQTARRADDRLIELLRPRLAGLSTDELHFRLMWSVSALAGLANGTFPGRLPDAERGEVVERRLVSALVGVFTAAGTE